MNSSDLGPLGIGELLDRAIAVYVRNFVPLFVILALAALPATVVQVAGGSGTPRVLVDLVRVLALSPADAAGRALILRDIDAHEVQGGWAALSLIFTVVLFPLSRNAVLDFGARALEERPATVAGAYRAALPRWASQVVVAGTFLAIAFGVMAAASGAIAVVAFAETLISSSIPSPAALLVGVPLAALVGGAVVALYAMIYLAWQMASVGSALEDPDPLAVTGRGLRRAFDRRLFRRSLGAALALAAVAFGGELAVVACGAFVVALTRIDLLYAPITALGSIALDGLVALFVLAYTHDVRVRREGIDLLLAADAPQPA